MVTSDSHVAEGILIHVVADFLNAVKEAHCALNSSFDCRIFTRILFHLFGQVVEDDLNESNQCNDECTKSDGSHMMHVGTLESIPNLGISFFILVISMIVEIVSGCTNNDDESATVLNPCGNPEESKEHE